MPTKLISPKCASWIYPILVVLLSACGGGGGGGGSDPAAASNPTTPPPTSTPTPASSTSDLVPATPNNNSQFSQCPQTPAVGSGAPSASAALVGRVTFDRIKFFAPPPGPWQTGPGLDYANPVVTPARGVIVEAVAATAGSCTGTVLDTAVTDGDGWYALNVDPARTVCVRARAQLYRADGAGAAWDVSIVDNTDSNSLYALSDSRFATARAERQRDLHAASGWSGGFTGARAAAPFAILDTACKAMNAVLGVQPDARFGAMTFRWSTRNTETANGNLTLGEIGGAFYSPSDKAVYLRGDAVTNIDEFDEMVIAHEFGHFVTDRFARADSVGGDHSLLDRLDPRLAFDEGWATAFAGLVLNSRVYRDSDEVATPGSPAREYYFFLDDMLYLESGWYTEASVHNLIYSFGEANNSDGVALGFGPIWRVFTQSISSDATLQTIFNFGEALKTNNPAEAGAIAALLNTQRISGDAIEKFANGETHAPDVARDLPVYTALPLSTDKRVCSRNQYAVGASTSSPNKLSMLRYLRLDIPASGNYRVSVTPERGTGLAGMSILKQGRNFTCASGNSNIESLIGGDSVALNCAMQNKTYVISVYQTDFSNDAGAEAGNYDQCLIVRAEAQ